MLLQSSEAFEALRYSRKIYQHRHTLMLNCLLTELICQDEAALLALGLPLEVVEDLETQTRPPR